MTNKEALDKWADFEVVDPYGGLALAWEYIGEGDSGDYDEEDPEDTPRLRASLYLGDTQVDDGSYCTLATPATPKQELIEQARSLIHSVDLEDHDGPPRLKNRHDMERWTWTR
jgi:hypothetical protein